jgi:hypothetical protein
MKGKPAKPILDSITEHPYAHFIISEAWAAIAGVAVYSFFHLGGYFTEQVSGIFPINDKGPESFLVSILSWGGALSASATFVIVSSYQIVILIRRLREGFDNGK